MMEGNVRFSWKSSSVLDSYFTFLISCQVFFARKALCIELSLREKHLAFFSRLSEEYARMYILNYEE